MWSLQNPLHHCDITTWCSNDVMVCFDGKVYTCTWLTEQKNLLWVGTPKQMLWSPLFMKGEMAAPGAYCDIYIHICMDVYVYECMYWWIYVCRQTCIYVLHRGVFWENKVSGSCSGCWFFNDRANYHSTLYAFIEQVNFYDLQKMVLQFVICFVPTMVYTYMVYTLRISAQSTNKLMYTHWNQAVLCTKELSAPPYIALRECMTFMTSSMMSQRSSNERFSC